MPTQVGLGGSGVPHDSPLEGHLLWYLCLYHAWLSQELSLSLVQVESIQICCQICLATATDRSVFAMASSHCLAKGWDVT